MSGDNALYLFVIRKYSADGGEWQERGVWIYIIVAFLIFYIFKTYQNIQ